MSAFRKLPFSLITSSDHQYGTGYVARLSDLEACFCAAPCECIDCQNGFYTKQEQYQPCFTYRGIVSDSDARRIAAQHVRNTQQDRAYVLQRLALQGDTVVNRWKKKSQGKRRALLVDAIPEICLQRWILSRYANTPESRQWEIRPRETRCQLLLPWLSVEVLETNPAILFSLLFNRTAHAPEKWAPYDCRQFTVSWACGHFDIEFSDKCVIMYGSKYGEVVDWQPGPAHRADILGFPRARLVLEAQAFLMAGLRQIVDKILEGVELNTPGSSVKWRAVTSVGGKHSGVTEFWSFYTNRAFSAAPIFDIDNILETVQVRLDAASDHLWLLQTEPAYMRRYLEILFQGEVYKVIKPEEAGVLATQELLHDIYTCWWWRWVRDESEYVKSMYTGFRDQIHSGERLPPKYDRALGALELVLINRVNSCGSYLSTVLAHRPGFRHRWTFESKSVSDGTTALSVQRKTLKDTKKMFSEDPLEWCLLQMQGAPDTQRNFDHEMLFAFLEYHLANSHAKERARVDEILYRGLSDQAAYHEMLVSVRLHRPQNEARYIDEVVKSEGRTAWKVMNGTLSFPAIEINKLAKTLFKDFYKAPLPSGSKNSTWLKRSEAIYDVLEAFWTGLRYCCKETLKGAGFNAKEILDTVEVLSAHLDPAYVNAVQAEKQLLLASIERDSEARSNPSQKGVVDVLTPQKGSVDAPTAQTSIPTHKPKIKTRPTTQSDLISAIERDVAGIRRVPECESPLKISVKKRVFDVLTLMFPTTAAEAAKSVEWDDFVRAMGDVGFTARNGGGSAVLFENEGRGEESPAGGKIVFHKPHPVAKLDSVMLHSMGKRMAKWFGWCRERFVLGSG